MSYAEELKERYKAVRARIAPKAAPINRAAEFRKVANPLSLSVKINRRYWIQCCGISTEVLRVSVDRMTFNQIEAFVRQYTGLTRAELWSQRRLRHLVQARHAVWVIARQRLPLSLPKIGQLSGRGFDHTTVLHACETYHPKSRAAEIVAAFDAVYGRPE